MNTEPFIPWGKTSIPFITEQNDPAKPPFTEREMHLLDALILAERHRDQLLALSEQSTDAHACSCSACKCDRVEFLKLKAEIKDL
jgi:hypothetical protein